MRDTYASLNEDLTAEPVHAEVRDVLRRMIEEGVPPVEVVEAAMATATALCLDLEGIGRTATRLLTVGTKLAEASPELQSKVALRRNGLGAASH
ncbi:hypothetical protein [Methylobacterium sp. Leaf106]|uniref:hypothetical protein n=1 Tax=Methylobacterium sp. Leaf106 TaxID=1736255 RepID=UPI0006FAC084|nr:hypothetical protein [Methylobacterium sp. Leaf106]KQP53037.1 hypothetical protein ASF34_01305 [Methylobacterium sp. Leaf106]